MPVKNRIQLRRGTSSEWAGSVDILTDGEMGYDTTLQNLKVGNGVDYWPDLPWLPVIGVSGQIINPSIVIADTGVFDAISFDTDVEPTLLKGQLSWNDTEGTVNIGLTDTADIHIGEHSFFRVRNETGDILYKGQVVYASGVHANGIILPNLYAADGTIREVRFMGFMLENLNNNNNGYAIQFGHIKELDTRGNVASNIAVGNETWADGDILYVHPTVPGKLTKVEPKHSIIAAIILDAASNGSIFVRPTSYGHLSDNHDVNVSGLVDNNLLVWNSGLDTWEPTTSMTFDGTTLHLDTDGISAKFGRDNALTAGGKVRIYVDDGDTASSNQAIKAFNNKSVGTNYGINATAYGSGTRNVALYGFADRASENWGLQVAAGIAYFQDKVAIKTSNPAYDLHVNGSGNFTGDVIVGGNLTIQGSTVIANVDSMEVEDPIVTLGLASGNIVTNTNLDRGLALALNNNTIAFMGWDVSENEFSLLSSGVASNSSGNYASGTYGDLHIAGLTATSANFSSTIDAANLGAGEDNSVVILDSDGKLRTDEIDSRVWGATLVDGAGSANHIAYWTDDNTLSFDNGQLYWDSSSNELGIGTNNPARNIDVVSSAGTSVGIKLNSTGTGGRSYSFFSTNNGSSLGGGKFGMYDDTAQAARLVIDGNGNIGVGTNSPTYKLEVDGSFSATTKSFKIKHPSKEGGILEYGSLESPYHGIRLTGKDRLKKGICIIKLPDYVKDLVQEEGINFQITNYKHHKILYVDKIDLNKNEITIKGYRCKSLGELEFFWTFSAIRKDVPELIVEK